MNEQVVLVDFENVQKLDPARLPAHARNGFEGNGPNALGLVIACHLGEGLALTPQAKFVIVSRDTGFDPLLRHLEARGAVQARSARDDCQGGTEAGAGCECTVGDRAAEADGEEQAAKEARDVDQLSSHAFREEADGRTDKRRD